MTSRRFGLANLLQWAGFASLLVMLTPGTAFATNFELSRLASQIELISGQLASELRYTRHYSSVRQRAVILRREAAQLADSLQRHRSNGRVRAHFKDVRRGYERLEQAFFKANKRDHIPSLYSEINHLSNVFTNLNESFHYAGLGRQHYDPVYGVPYRATLGRDRVFRTVRQAWRGPNYRGDKLGGLARAERVNRRDKPGRAGLDRATRTVHSAPPSAHRSKVLERQARQDSARRGLERQVRRQRSPAASSRQSFRGGAFRGNNRQDSRGGVVNIRRQNH